MSLHSQSDVGKGIMYTCRLIKRWVSSKQIQEIKKRKQSSLGNVNHSFAHVRESNTVLDSGFHAMDSGFQVLDFSWILVGYRITWAVFRIPKPRIPDSTSKNFTHSAFHEQKFSGIRFLLHMVNSRQIIDTKKVPCKENSFYWWFLIVINPLNLYKGKGAHEPKAQTAGAYRGFISMKHLRVLLLLPGRDASPSRGYPPAVCRRYPFIHLGEER